MAVEYIANKMQYTGEVFGIPEVPVGFGDFVKSNMAWKVVTECFERAKGEVWEYLRGRIEREGLGVLRGIMEGGPVLVGLPEIVKEGEEKRDDSGVVSLLHVLES